MYYFSEKTCLNRDRDTNKDQIVICTDNFCKYHSCINHCCPPGHYLKSHQVGEENILDCFKDISLNDTLWTENTDLKIKSPKNGSPIPTFANHGTDFLQCQGGPILPASLNEYDISIDSNGALQIDGSKVEFGRYCVNRVPSIGNTNSLDEVYYCTVCRDSYYDRWMYRIGK